MYYTPNNYMDMKVGAEIRDVHFGINWTVVEKRKDGTVIIQNQPPEGAKIYLSADTSSMIFYG